VQMMCIWSSWCHCHPAISCFIKIQIGITLIWCRLTQVVLEKRQLNWCLLTYWKSREIKLCNLTSFVWH